MKKKLIFIAPVLSLIILLSLYYLGIFNTYELPEKLLIKTFSNSGAKTLSSEIYFFSRLDGQFKTLEDLKKMSDEFIEAFGLEKKNILKKGSYGNDSVEKLEVTGSYKDSGLVKISLQLTKNSSDNKGSYISVDITNDTSSSELLNIRDRGAEVFKRHGLVPQINSCITGNLEGRLSEREVDAICNNILKEAGARNIQGINDKNLMSVSAYSPFIEKFIRLNGKKINLNLAVRYNSYENKTYIWLATPVISTEY